MGINARTICTTRASSTRIRPERKEKVPPSEVDAHDGRLLGPERRQPVLVRCVCLDRRVVRDVDLKVVKCWLDLFASCINKIFLFSPWCLTRLHFELWNYGEIVQIRSKHWWNLSDDCKSQKKTLTWWPQPRSQRKSIKISVMFNYWSQSQQKLPPRGSTLRRTWQSPRCWGRGRLRLRRGRPRRGWSWGSSRDSCGERSRLRGGRVQCPTLQGNVRRGTI